MFRLEKLCLDSIIVKFERFYFAFTLSNNANLQRQFQFLQKRFSVKLATGLHAENKLKDEYLDFLINEHLNLLVGGWFESSRYLNSMENTFSRLPNLTRICFTLHGADEVLENIAKFCPKIVEIDVRFSDVTDNGIKHLCDLKNGMIPCPALKNIFLPNTWTSYPAVVTDEGVEYLIRNLPSLERIEYDSVPQILHSLHKENFSDLDKVHQYNLVELKLFGFRLEPNYTDILKTCLSVCPKLKSIACEIYCKEELNLITSFQLKKLHLQFRPKRSEVFSKERSKIYLANFIKRVGINLTSLKICGSFEFSYKIPVSLLAVHCPVLEELYVHEASFSNDDNNHSLIVFSYLTKCVFSSIDPSTVKEACVLLSSSPKLKSISIRCMLELPPEIQSEILIWCKNTSAKLVEFVFIKLKMKFIKDILLNSSSLKAMFLYQCRFDTRDTYKFLCSFVKTQFLKSRIYFKEYDCFDNFDESRERNGINYRSLFRDSNILEICLKEEYKRSSIYDFLFKEIAFFEIYSNSDYDWESLWQVISY